LDKIRNNSLGRQFPDEDFHSGTNIFFMAIVIHVENFDIELQNVACMFGMNIIPGDISEKDILEFNIISTNFII